MSSKYYSMRGFKKREKHKKVKTLPGRVF